MRKWLLRAPTYAEFLGLLAAWRVWLLGAVAGGLLALLIYAFAPPPFRAQATVLVDHNVEDVIPVEAADRERFYYLQQENDKLIEIAWSDEVLQAVSAQSGLALADLRGGVLRLSQPGDGGWHFLADSRDPQEAAAIASAWAESFYAALQQGGAGISPVLESSLAESVDLPVSRSISSGVYIFFGGLVGVACLALGVLFIGRKET
jgi:hypothetical protein